MFDYSPPPGVCHLLISFPKFHQLIRVGSYDLFRY